MLLRYTDPVGDLAALKTLAETYCMCLSNCKGAHGLVASRLIFDLFSVVKVAGQVWAAIL